MAPSTTNHRRSLATTVTSWGACAAGGKVPMPVVAQQPPTTRDRYAIRLRAR